MSDSKSESALYYQVGETYYREWYVEELQARIKELESQVESLKHTISDCNACSYEEDVWYMGAGKDVYPNDPNHISQ